MTRASLCDRFFQPHAVKRVLLPSPVLLGVLALAFSATASAQGTPPPGAACPPGSWFCADTNTPSAAPAGQPVQPLQQLPPTVQYQPAPAPPPVVVYQPPPPVVIVNAPRPDTPPVYYYAPRVAYPRKNEWGANLHLQGALLGGGRNHDSGMGGGGLGLRYKPIPHIGVEADLDFAGGHDYNGLRRTETAFTLNGLVFLNPKSHLQVYLLAGFGWSGAHVVDDSAQYVNSSTQNYGYFGGQAGAGLEWRISRHFALNADLRGFIRGRIDDDTHAHPEFYDPGTGRTTNTSGGGLVTGGMTFYF